MVLPAMLDDLMAACRAAPDDDGPRLVWADAVGGERGELVVIQIELARKKLAPRDAIVLRRRQRELLARHGAEWSGLTGLASRASFSRGFVDAVQAPGNEIGAIVERAPLLSSFTTYDTSATALFANAAWPQLRGLDVVATLQGPAPAGALQRPWGRSILERVAESQLTALGIRLDGLSAQSMYPVMGKLQRIERLSIRPYRGDEAIGALLGAGALDAMRSLELSSLALERGAVLPSGIRELTLHSLDEDELALIGPIAPTLERLELHRPDLPRALELLARFPRLVALAIHARTPRPDDDERIRTFVSRPLPALRELAMRASLGLDATRLVVDAFGAQLELLDLRGNPHALRYVNELKPKIAGELLVGEPPQSPGLLRVGPTLQMPWWDHVAL